MRPPFAIALTVVALLCFALEAYTLAGPSGSSRAAGASAPRFTARPGQVQFAADVPRADRAWIRRALDNTTPGARALVDRIGGSVIVTGAGRPAGAHALGAVGPTPAGYTLWLDLAQLDGLYRSDRDFTILHELAHVVDRALLTPSVARTLDAGIPASDPCRLPGASVYCDARRERFADTFAKWAFGGIVPAHSGYEVPAPPSLDAWGLPLTALGAQ